jgi:hypothetical protein
MTGIFEQGAGGVDLAAVARDAELIDRLAVRAPLAVDDDVARLLFSLAAEVDDGLDALLAELEAPLLEQEDSTANVGTPARRRAYGLRATTVAIVVGATLSVSGVAAAVTGDPLAPYKGIVRAVTNAEAPSPHASTTAKLNHLATGTQAKIAHGDFAGARADIAALQAAIGDPSISDHDKALLQIRLRNLMRSLAHAEAIGGPNPQATAKSPHSTQTPKAQQNGKPSSHATPSHQSTHTPQSGGGGSTAKPTTTPGAKAQGTGKGEGGSGTAVESTPVTTPDPDATAATGGGGNGGSAGGGSTKEAHTPRSRVSTSAVASTDTSSQGRSAH